MCLFPQKVIKYGVCDEYTGEYKHLLKFVNQDKIDKVFNNMIYKDKEIIHVPCNKCVECFRSKSIEWSYRIQCEAIQYKHNCMITLTYRNTNGELNKRDLQLFMKRLRKALEPKKIRFFACGEYGSRGERPHYHLIIFGFIPNDLVPLKYEDNYIIYNSSFLSSIWQKGFISVMYLNSNNTKYVAKYMQKLNEYSNKKVKPFFLMSNRPGIGFRYFSENLNALLIDDRLYIEGNYISLPRYVLKIAEQRGFDLSMIKDNRKKRYILSSKLINLEKKRLYYVNLLTKIKI